MKRRDFLIRTLAGAGGILLLSVSAPGCSSVEVPIDVTGILPRDASRIGKAWLDQSSDRPPRVEALFGGQDWTGAKGPDVLARLAKMVQADFEAGRTVQVSGWVLATTEVRLSALMHWEARQATAEAKKPKNKTGDAATP